MEDAYIKYASSRVKRPRSQGKAYRIRGHREPFYTLNIIHGLLSAVCTAKNAAPAPESVAEEADEESSDSAAAASEPTDEGDVSDSPDSSGASDEPAAPSAEIQPTVD